MYLKPASPQEKIMIERGDYRQIRDILLAEVSAVETEEAALEAAAGRVLAQEVVAAQDVPAFARSPYDGYAFRAEDVKDAYRSVYAGGLVSYDESILEGGFAAANTLAGRDIMKVAVAGNADRILLISHFDNLGKGASGAAVQCLNLTLGLDMATGLAL